MGDVSNDKAMANTGYKEHFKDINNSQLFLSRYKRVIMEMSIQIRKCTKKTSNGDQFGSLPVSNIQYQYQHID